MGRRKLKIKSKAGGAQNNKEKMEIDPQPGLSSSSSKSSNVQAEINNQEPSKSDKIYNEQVEKKLDEESASHVEAEGNSLIDELPSEMVMKILECLDVKSLALSRLVSRKWNGMAREILQSRNDVETVFCCRQAEDGHIKIDGKTERSSLENFIKWFEDSKETPLYTRFLFGYIRASDFLDVDWIKFISTFGASIKCLRLVGEDNQSLNDTMRFTVELRNLILNKLPNLQEFGLQFVLSHWSFTTPFLPRLELFPGTTIKLPHLKILYLDEAMFSNFAGIVSDLLLASANLQKIEPFEKYDFCSCTESFHFLQSLGKIHCLQQIKISLDTEFLSEFQEKSSVPWGLKLKNLNLGVSSLQYNDKNTILDATIFLSNLFESSKDTLKDLATEPLSSLLRLQLPKFSKLTNLCIPKKVLVEWDLSLSGINLLNSCPVLKFLELPVRWSSFVPCSENVSCIPTLKTLKITAFDMSKEDIARISQVCPNLKELDLGYFNRGDAVVNFPEVGTAIWTHLKQLESLHLMIKVDSLANAFPAIDSCFTGFSNDDCIRLYDLIQVEKLTGKWGSWINLSRSKLEADRQNASILDLKGLNNLTVYLGSSASNPNSVLSQLSQGLFVSVKYAFKLMDGLNYKILKYRV